MRLIIIFLITIFLFSCNENVKSQDELLMKIDYVESHKKDTLNIQIINNSSKIYFICMDSLRIYENNEFNAKLNRLVHPRIVFYSRGDSIGSGPIIAGLPNYISKESYKLNFNCVMQNIKKRPQFIKQLKALKKILILKSMDTLIMSMSFKNRYEICNNKYIFKRDKGNYEIELKYKMDTLFFNEIVDKNALENLKKQNIYPYYKEIKSNKIPLNIN